MTRALRRVFKAAYDLTPQVAYWLLRPFLRRATEAGRKFLDKRTAYDEAVYSMGSAHWDEKVQRLGLSGCFRVLDVGCGPGQWLLPLANSNAQVVGVDLDQRLLEVARRHVDGDRRVALMKARAEALCFRGASFDAVLCYSVLMYTDHRAALAEISRVLKPGGLLVIGFMGLGYYLKHVIEGVRCGQLEAVRYGVGPILARLAQFLPGRRSQAVIPWTDGHARKVLRASGLEMVDASPDLKDPSWPRSYLGVHFYFCVRARKPAAV